MKTMLKILAGLALFASLTSGCRHETENDPILYEANNIIASYSSSKPNFACSFVEDAIIYPEPWTEEAADTFGITGEELKNTTTCGLIQTFFNQPWNILGPWCSTCSDLSIDGMQYFNDRVNQDIILSELFSREDALDKLIGKYIGTILNLTSMEEHPGFLYSFEILLASELMSEILTDIAGKELMILVLRMIDVKKGNNEFSNENSIAITRHILANILFQKEFEPFLSACLINGSLETFLLGYKVCYENKKVEEYAKMYLKME